MEKLHDCKALSGTTPVLLLVTSLVGCVTSGENIPDQVILGPPATAASRPAPVVGAFASRADGTFVTQQGPRAGPASPLIVRGSSEQPSAPPDPKFTPTKEGSYVLNFENADIRDVARTVLNDMLGTGYILDPAVQGSITLRTARPLPREAVLPAFEDALKLAGAALVPAASGYQIVPLQGAAQRGALGAPGSALQPGYQVRVVPLRYVAASAIQRALDPIVAPGTVFQGDPEASFVTLSGTASELERAERAIALFDVDWLRNQSVGLFPLRYSSAKNVSDDLSNVVGKRGPLAGLVQITPIEHLNSILVVSRNSSYVDEMRTWIERFDRGRDVLKPRLFVYHVQNGRARDLAAVLARVFRQSEGRSGSASSANEAPAASDGIAPMGSPFGSPGQGAPSNPGRGAPPSGLSTEQTDVPTSAIGGSLSSESSASGNAADGIRITADEVNNALLIVTTPTRYVQVEAALARLDIVPLQVMLEASIAEVNVNDTFKYGVQVAFQNGDFSALSSTVAASALATSTGGLSAAFIRSDIKATLDLLSTFTKVRVISSPKLLVLNNRTAAIQVGDQVPIATSSAVSNITPNAPTVNAIQLYDTGIILRVTPRVNRSGLVLMDISQEVSASVPTSTSSINSPTIRQRRVATSVAVADGQTIAIGGLIRDNRNNGRTGIPVLKDIPGIGAIFGMHDDGMDRTELMVLISPRVIRSPRDADAATDELSAKLPMLRARRDAVRAR